MLLTYYTLRALASEWDSLLHAATILEAYSQTRSELAIAVKSGDVESTLFVRLGGPLRCIYRRAGHSKARRNVASALSRIAGTRITRVEAADRDRHVFFVLEGDVSLQITPFGPRPNVYLVGPGGLILDAFLQRDAHVERTAPSVRPAPIPQDFPTFRSRWNAASSTAETSATRAHPLFDRTLAREALSRAAVDPAGTADLEDPELMRCWMAAKEIDRELRNPVPRIYSDGSATLEFSLLPLRHLSAATDEVFHTVDEAAMEFVSRRLAEEAFRVRFEPVERALIAEELRLDRSIARMREETTSASRADQYERFAHVLMALSNEVRPGETDALLPDVFEPGHEIRIPLDPSKSAVENAEVYYGKARQTRASRTHAQRRLLELEARHAEVRRALTHLRASDRVADIRQVEERHAVLLSSLPSAGGKDGDEPRFRRYVVSGGYEVLVGRNAGQNDLLTFKYASKHDVWLHARGVAGSHVILRVPSKTENPPGHSIEAAASIAGYFSKAAGSALVSVIVTRRKFVRKARKGPPGTVLVDREEVVLVPPRIPDVRPDTD